MAASETPLILAAPEDCEHTLDAVQVGLTAEVLIEAGYVDPDGAARVRLTGPGSERPLELEVPPNELADRLAGVLQPEDALSVALSVFEPEHFFGEEPLGSDGRSKRYAILQERRVRPEFVTGVTLEAHGFLIGKTAGDDVLECGSCGEELLQKVEDIVDGDYVVDGEHEALLEACPDCDEPVDAGELAEEHADTIALTHFWVAFELPPKAHPGEPAFDRELVEELSRALGCQVRPWYDLW